MTGFRSILDLLGIKAPDIRAWACMGGLAITFYVLWMIYNKPELLDKSAFTQLIGIVIGGTVIAVYNNLFGGTRSGQEMQKGLIDAAKGPGTGAGSADGVTK